jgi:hypothetical protein
MALMTSSPRTAYCADVTCVRGEGVGGGSEVCKGGRRGGGETLGLIVEWERGPGEDVDMSDACGV